MLFICGTCKNGERRIFSAESTPTVEHMDVLNPCSLSSSLDVDWGPAASNDACNKTAYLVLSQVTNPFEAALLADRYADQVIRTIKSDRLWMLPVGEIETWLKANRTV